MAEIPTFTKVPNNIHDVYTCRNLVKKEIKTLLKRPMPTIYHIKQIKTKHKIRSCRKPSYKAELPGQTWVIDTVKDVLWNGRTVETICIKDGYTKKVIHIGTETWLPEMGTIILFEQLKKVKPLPEFIFINAAMETLSIHVDIWCKKHKVKLGFAQKRAIRAVLFKSAERSKSLEKIVAPASFKTVREALSFSKEQANTQGSGWFRKKNKR
jgi:hypothetical protein